MKFTIFLCVAAFVFCQGRAFYIDFILDKPDDTPDFFSEWFDDDDDDSNDTDDSDYKDLATYVDDIFDSIEKFVFGSGIICFYDLISISFFSFFWKVVVFKKFFLYLSGLKIVLNVQTNFKFRSFFKEFNFK